MTTTPDDPKLTLVPYVDDRNFLERFAIPEHVMARERVIARLVRDFRSVAMEFGEHEEEYQCSTSSLSRQDIDDIRRHLLAEIARTDSINRGLIRKLRNLRPQKIWSRR